MKSEVRNPNDRIRISDFGFRASFLPPVPLKYLEEYRNAEAVRQLAAAIGAATTRPWNIMEICGGQTHSIVRFGLDEMLPRQITLIHGPGCPVCVTPIEILDKAVAIAGRPEVTFCSFGDMLRVPGSRKDLFTVKSEGGDVRVVYSPMDAVALAQERTDRQVVFFAVGFETTAPANAMAIAQAARLGLKNFSVLVSHVLVPPAMRAVLDSPSNRVQGFLAAGHVCTIAGIEEYRPIAETYRVPIVVTGFEPVDILQGVLLCVKQLEQGRHEVENQYARCVRPEGNRAALREIAEVFRVVPRKWRGIGEIPASGLALRQAYADFDAERQFHVEAITADEPTECIAGEILQGHKKPHDCPAFGVYCTPERPLGAPMVSTEGACAAYYRYRRRESRGLGIGD
jgi:hydrogenase expression/formation protein HypD